MIGSEFSPNVDAALVVNTGSEHVIEQWRTGDGADFWKGSILASLPKCHDMASINLVIMIV